MASQSDSNGDAHRVLISNFVQAVACHSDQAQDYLKAAHWDFQKALSLFLRETLDPIEVNCNGEKVPSNTPVTPPYYLDALNNLQALQMDQGSPHCASNRPS